MQLAEMKQDRFFVYAMPILRVMGLPVQVLHFYYYPVLYNSN